MDWVIVAATVVIALSALASLWLNWRLSQDNRALRKAGTEPEVVAYLGVEHHAAYLVYLVLENVGQGPACDVGYFVDAAPDDFAKHNVRKLPARTHRTVASLLPQGGRTQLFMGDTYSLLGSREESGLEPFKVRVCYSNLRGISADSKEFLLDVSELGDLAEVVPAEERIASSLKKIQEQLGQLARGSARLHVETITTDEREARNQELRARSRRQAAGASEGVEEA
ncbi:MAG: hypothetical protein OXH41_13540 [Chloroflexi bacterium]|nr:hypothetical protein [Chloroflexota bacterium]